jgi:hypothetical protein
MKNSQIVGINEKYSDNEGATSTAFYVENGVLKSDMFASGYGGRFDDYTAEASNFTKLRAISLYRNPATNDLDLPVNIGSVVTLKRSRKLPNRVALTICEIVKPYYNGYDYTPLQYGFKINGILVYTAANCLNLILKNPFPNFIKL